MIEDFQLSDITVLAPTNEAFQALELGAIAYLKSPNVTCILCINVDEYSIGVL